MGGLRKYMPITYLHGADRRHRQRRLPPFAGFFSKDTIIEAVHAAYSRVPGGRSLIWLRWARCRAAASIRSGWCFCISRRGALPRARAWARRVHGHGDRATRRRRDADAMRREEPAVGHAWHPRIAGGRHIPLILLAIPSICARWVIGTSSSATISAMRSIRLRARALAELAANSTA
jgi:NADH-quinone oxidoreductase subunit L